MIERLEFEEHHMKICANLIYIDTYSLLPLLKQNLSFSTAYGLVTTLFC
jgi:hypothetical protein